MSTEIDKTVRDSLNMALAEKTKAYYEVKSRRAKRECELRREVDAKLNAEFGEEMSAAEKARCEANAALEAEDARVKEIESLASLPYPIGTKLVGWTPSRSLFGGRPVSFSKNGNTGVLEVFKMGDPISATNSWRKPKGGEVVVRMLKKDGSKGLNLEKWIPGHSERYWFTEGVNPNEKKG